MSNMIPFGNITKLRAVSLTVAPSQVGANTTIEQDITIPGVKVGDIVICVGKPSHNTGVTIGNMRVKAANTISVQFVNATASPITPTSESYVVVIGRPETIQPSFND